MSNLRKIDVKTIHVGSCFSDSVYFDDGVYMFLPANKPAKPYHIAVLKNWNIPFLLTSGNEIIPPEDALTFVDDNLLDF